MNFTREETERLLFGCTINWSSIPDDMPFAVASISRKHAQMLNAAGQLGFWSEDVDVPRLLAEGSLLSSGFLKNPDVGNSEPLITVNSVYGRKLSKPELETFLFSICKSSSPDELGEDPETGITYATWNLS
ncbi:hypothetical protein [cf. Phormidesmis sp. LEGE 11477]|uniref:hypothetical protein n=1 Tax=cf. Phormidesmis sp. LEGE 11477 TaxID=1828680 RepID=UPI00188206F0|nr:hypothetical protein [cf. Phormidesmis sp. LEGE 11477]MBE9063422.1 hypothetical protein [cf. Phormidesmis sp. LEGE 11477]